MDNLQNFGIVLELVGFCILFNFPRKLLGFLLSLSVTKNRKLIQSWKKGEPTEEKSIDFKKYSSFMKGLAIFFVIIGLILQFDL